MQIEAADGLPLAVCYGKTSIDVQTFNGVRWTSFDGFYSGCGQIFADTVVIKGHMFRMRCSRCDHSKTNPERAARRNAVRLT